METKNRMVQVEIFGQSYNLKGDADPAYINELSDYVDQKMREVSSAAPTVESLKIAILAALNIADETRRQTNERDIREKEVNEKLESLLEGLNRCLDSNREPGRDLDGAPLSS